jgi:superoxide reductase
MVEFYRCSVCGHMVALIKKGGGTLVCCGKEMVKLEANSTDASQEKHVPVVAKEGGKIKAAIGSVAHPMLPEHFIEWIALVCDDKVEIKFLKPGEEPKVEFNEVKTGTVYAYCNLHGLWKTDF